jgi:hypothetical protein
MTETPAKDTPGSHLACALLTRNQEDAIQKLQGLQGRLRAIALEYAKIEQQLVDELGGVWGPQ